MSARILIMLFKMYSFLVIIYTCFQVQILPRSARCFSAPQLRPLIQPDYSGALTSTAQHIGSESASLSAFQLYLFLVRDVDTF